MTGIVERVLGLTAVGDDVFEAPPVHTVSGDAYGGEILARALWAMTSTVGDGRLPHSIHSYYLRPAQNGETTTFTVGRERDGRSFSSRRVAASQRGKDMFVASAGFHLVPEVDPVARFQQPSMPDVPAPESLDAGPMGHLLLDVRRAMPDGDGPVRIWARAVDPLPDDPAVHLCLLAYLSDYHSGLFGTPLGGNDVISLDHVMWLHRLVRMDEWVLMSLEPVAVALGRGTYRGTMFDVEGAVLATFVQEMYGMPRNHPNYATS